MLESTHDGSIREEYQQRSPGNPETKNHKLLNLLIQRDVLHDLSQIKSTVTPQIIIIKYTG